MARDRLKPEKGEVKAAAIIDAMIDGVTIIDLQGRIIDINRATTQQHGYEKEEAIGRTSEELFMAEKDRPKFLKAVRRVSAGKPVKASDYLAIHKDGTEFLASISLSVLKDSEGRPSAVVVVHRDITGRQQAEGALQEDEERFRSLVEATSDWIWEVDPNGTYTYASPKVKELLGYEPDEIIGKTPFDFMPAEEAKRVAAEFAAIVEARRPFSHLENLNLHKDGRIVMLETSGVPIFNANGDWLGYRGIDRDTTERKQAEERLKASEEYSRRLIDSSLDMIISVDMKRRIVEFNQAAEEAFGYTRAEVMGNHVDMLYADPQDGWRVHEIASKAGQFTGEITNKRKSGETFPCFISASILRDSKGEILGIMGVSKDITESKRAEEALVERAAALARAEELQRSRQRIVATQESLRKDIAQQLHGSVQNRLIVLLHRLTELEHAALPGELAAELGDLRQELNGLLESHVRPISHRLYPSILRRGIVPALQSLGDQFEAVLVIEMELDEQLIRREKADRELTTEQTRLAVYRIAEEALANVVKHAKASSVTVGLELSSEGWLCLTVRDDGQGFDVGMASGGMGLLLIQDYAEAAGGACVIRSAPDKGTEVIANVPLASSGAKHSERASPLE